ncbi:MAG: UPF0149 family protein [Thiogranum sp.]
MEPLGESEFGELDELLLSDDVPEACMDVVTLEGFLTAIAIGPVTVMPEHWLPRVFGSEAEDPMPELPSVKVFKHVVNLIMRLYNSVIMIFEIAPEEFNPTFYTHEVEGKSYTIVDEWCSGFLQGIALANDAWQPLLDENPGILRPLQLFATPEGWAELDAAPDEAVMHAEWSSKIAPTIRAIHAYWLPYREGSVKSVASHRPKRVVDKPKVERNAPCPCGSGKKYKYCCGSSGTLH